MTVRARFLLLLQFLRSGRAQAAIVPDQLQRRHLTTPRKMISHHGGQWISFLIHPRRTGFHAGRMPKLQRAKDRIASMTADIAERAGPEIPPTAPFERQVGRIVRPKRRRAEPKIP